MQTEFTPFLSLIGGGFIGLSAVILLATTGRIAGISGIVSRLLPPAVERSGAMTVAVFVLGLLLAAPLAVWVGGAMPEASMAAGSVTLAVAGVLVGFGAVLGNGCTSGHGVCGLSRFSVRSMVATGVFMATGVATVFVLRHVIGG